MSGHLGIGILDGMGIAHPAKPASINKRITMMSTLDRLFTGSLYHGNFLI